MLNGILIQQPRRPSTNFLIKRLLNNKINILGKDYLKDEYTNVTPKILADINRNLYLQPHHPLNHVRKKIVNYFYKTFRNNRGNPQFSIYDNLSSIVTIEQNFDSLLVPKDHPSRSKSDCYYINKDLLLRAHMTAHQSELLKSTLTNFLMIGDVYRRDEIDKTHYPIFHQIDGVRLKDTNTLFENNADDSLQIFNDGDGGKCFNFGIQQIQTCHTLEAVKLMEHELKTTLTGLAQELFGDKIESRWIDTTFPFTQPSWELEVNYNNQWLELLGCGIMKDMILKNCGITDRIGWAFGLGLERIAMCLFQIPDIRLFWSKDSGFLNQFKIDDDDDDDDIKSIIYKPISQFPQCINDISFWLPMNLNYSSNDFYDLVRNIGGDMIEQVVLVDEFTHPKTNHCSHCYRIVYRHMERTLTQNEVNEIHKQIEQQATQLLGVTIR